MQKIIAGNFKMNKTLAECKDYADKFKSFTIPSNRTLIFCPPIYAMEHFNHAFFRRKNVLIGAQNCAREENGALTGEISAQMIKSAGANVCIVGHSERRIKLGETNADINTKLKLLVHEGVTPILCIGETLSETSRRKSVLSKQLEEGLKNIDVSQVIIAYEPVWAIGTGKTCSLEIIKEVHAYIKSKIERLYGKLPKVLYGGSVNEYNAGDILRLDCVDGVLVGGASLNPDTFYKVLTAK